ncbi:MAG: hypothetical protein K0S01_3702 [Herbinix sp.]|jgi:hypothetical protein|nr:hypothetical protein [Herbinix sp.]
MKKNFFKKLSFVLALAMIISTITPAAGALAATKAPKLNATKVYLHLDPKSTNDYDFNVSNKVSGWKYKWTSKNADVASVESNGLVTAEGVGTTTVSVAISNKGEAVKTLKATVVVRDNIKSLKITNTPVGDKLAVGKANDFNRSFVTASGSTKKTSGITRWSVKEEGATITDSGLFTATKAGEYTITANAFQSTAKYSSWLADSTKYASYVTATTTYTVKVAASMTSSKQTGLATFEVNFDSAMTDVAKNLSVSSLVGTTKVKQLVKEVKMDAANKVATVTLYIPFTAETTYVVDYTDMASTQFTAATTKAEDVKTMTVSTTKAVLNTETPVEVKLFNAAGVDISTTELLARVTMKSTGEAYTYFNESAKKIFMYKTGVTATISATYHTYKYNTTTGTEEGNVLASGVLTCVDADATGITGLNAWTIVSPNGLGVYDPNFSDVKQTVAAGDSLYRLFVKYDTLTGTTASTVNSKDNAGYFEYTSSDEGVLMIMNDGTLVPNKQGAAVVVVKYGTGSTKTTIGAITVTVGDKRTATGFTLSTYDFTLSNAAFNDNKDVELTLKDQLGSFVSYNTYSVEKISGPTGSNVIVPNPSAVKSSSDNYFKINFSGLGAAEGTYVYKITVKDISRVVTVVVKNINPLTDTVSYYRLELSDATKDVAATYENTNKSLTVALFGYTSSGAKMTRETLGAVDTAPFTVDIDAPYNTVTSTDDKNADNTNGTYTLVSAVSGAVIDKVPVGSYKVTAYKLTAGVNVPVDVQYFTITDTQKAPVIGEVKSRVYTTTVANYVSTEATLLAAVKECFKITLDGADVNADITAVEASGTGTSTYVTSVTVRQAIKINNSSSNVVYVDHKVAIGQYITKK